MRVLTPACFILACMIAFTGCTPQAALTPQAAFHDLKNAFRTSDSAALERQLSAASVRKVREMTSLFSKMGDRQLGALAGKFGVAPERLRNLSVRDYCALILTLDREKSVIGIATSRAITGIDRNGSRATVRVDNGMELTFIKEGPYWKFDMAGL